MPAHTHKYTIFNINFTHQKRKRKLKKWNSTHLKKDHVAK